MANGIGTATTLYAESTASAGTGAQHAPTSGQTNRALATSSGGAQYIHGIGAGILPSLTGAGHLTKNGSSTGAATLPSLTGVGYGGAGQNATLPTLTGTASGSNTIHGAVAATLPTLTGAATGLTGGMGRGAATLPLLQAQIRTGARMAATLPALQGGSGGRTDNHGTMAQWLPKLVGSAIGHRSRESGSGAGILPKLTTGYLIRVGVILPKLQGSASGTNGAPIVTGGYAYNCDRGAVTTLTNYSFIAFVRFKDRHYGVGRNGNLYLMGADTDDGTPIPWAFETGLDDLGSAAQKGLRGVYIDGVIETGAEVTVVTDTGRYTYNTGNAVAAIDHRTYRVVTGKGIRTRNIGIGMSSTKGGYCEVDMISPKYDISKRSV